MSAAQQTREIKAAANSVLILAPTVFSFYDVIGKNAL
jgi:hypothetical protein